MVGCDLSSSLFLTPQALPVVFNGSQMLQFEAWFSFQGFDLSVIFRPLMLSQPWATLGFAFLLPLWESLFCLFQALEAMHTPAGFWVLLEHQLVVECLLGAVKHCPGSLDTVARDK